MKVKETEISYLKEQIETRSEYLNEIYQEELSAGSGAIAGIGVGPQGEPGVDPRLMPMARRKKRKKKNGDC